jgi:hypoxanthine phosphoribosyltransferase
MSPQTLAASSSEFNDPNLRVIFSEDEIRARIAEMGAAITADYNGKDLVLVGVLKGSCVVLADLMRAIDLPLTIDFMSVSSYKDGTTSTGDVEILKDLSNSIRGKDVVVVEDIVDTGLTLTRLLEILGTRGANSVRLASFLDKPEPRINKDLSIDYTGFVVPNEFVVGYGLDAAGRYRNLPFIAVVRDPAKV